MFSKKISKNFSLIISQKKFPKKFFPENLLRKISKNNFKKSIKYYIFKK